MWPLIPTIKRATQSLSIQIQKKEETLPHKTSPRTSNESLVHPTCNMLCACLQINHNKY